MRSALSEHRPGSVGNRPRRSAPAPVHRQPLRPCTQCPALLYATGQPRPSSPFWCDCETIETYFANPDCLPSLNAANGSDACQRKEARERREACLSLLGALIHHLDLVTLRVGLPKTTAPCGSSMPFSPNAVTGLRRAERPAGIWSAGLLKSIRVEATAEGGHRGFRAIRRFRPRYRSGLDAAWFQRERDKATQRQRRRQRRQETTRTAANAGRRELALEAARQRSAPPPTPASPTVTESNRRQQARTILGAVLDQLRADRPPLSGITPRPDLPDSALPADRGMDHHATNANFARSTRTLATPPADPHDNALSSPPKPIYPRNALSRPH